MVTAQPHFLLFSGIKPTGKSGGRWHFLLESLDGETVIEAADEEAGYRGERLELLALVRGLEALDQPSRVTLITSSRDISRGIRYGLEEWRANHWCWERDGRWVPVKNHDLWQRVDRALRFHRIDCRRWRTDESDESLAMNDVTVAPEAISDNHSMELPTAPTSLPDSLGFPSRWELANASPAKAPVGDGLAAVGSSWWQAVSRIFRPSDVGPTWVSAN